MKYLIAVVFALFSMLAMALPAQLPAENHLKNAAVALTVGWVASFTSVVTGNMPQLCNRLRGTYDPTGPDRCPDGQWQYLFSGPATPK